MTNDTLYHKKPRIFDNILYILIYICAAITLLLICGIIVYCFYKGAKIINWDFLTSAPSIRNKTLGIGGNILNTIYIIILSLIVAIPFGVGSAVYLNEYMKSTKLYNAVNFTTETLAGIPSIIFGMFGMEFFGAACGFQFSILTGALTLSILVFPIITGNALEALKCVPQSYRDGALGMGTTKWHMIKTIILPTAMPGILTGVILSIGRIVGESAALIFTSGSGYQLPQNAAGYASKIMESGGTMSVQLYLSMSNADFDTAYGLAAVLLVIVLVINFVAKRLLLRFDNS